MGSFCCGFTATVVHEDSTPVSTAQQSACEGSSIRRGTKRTRLNVCLPVSVRRYCFSIYLFIVYLLCMYVSGRAPVSTAMHDTLHWLSFRQRVTFKLCLLTYKCLHGLAPDYLSHFCTLLTGLRRSDHVTDTLASFHWLRGPERIDFKLAVLVYRALHGTAPRYLSDLLRRVADLPSRRHLRSATSSKLNVRPSRLVTVGDRSFASAGPKLWNSLPDDTASASSLSVFRKKLKTHLFRQSYPDVIF